MSQQGYSIGRDVSVVVTLPNGTNLPLGKVTSFSSKPETTKTKIKGLDGVNDTLRFIKFLGLGGALAGLGGAAMAALPWIALIAGAAFLIYRNWSSIYPWLVKIWTIIRAVWKVGTDDIIAQAKALWAVVGPVMRPIFFALSWIFNKIIKFVGSVVGGLINLGYGEARTILGEGGAPKPVPPPRPAAVPTAPKRGADGLTDPQVNGITTLVVPAKPGAASTTGGVLNA